MNAFEKRVALVEKWHTDLTKSLDDMYDLAEQVLDVWQEAESHTEERIIKLLESKRCECLDLDKEQFVELAKKEGLLKHANCDWVGLDWAIELIKGEAK